MKSVKSGRIQKRTILLSILVLVAICLSFMGWLRLYGALSGGLWLRLLDVKPGLIYIAISGALSGIAGLIMFLGLLLRWKKGATLARIIMTLFLAWYWIDDLLFTHSPNTSTSIVFRGIASLIGLVFVYIVLALPAQRRYFNENE